LIALGHALAFQAVSFAYRRSPVFSSLDLAFEEGGWTAILGPNGTGKTTLLRLAGGGLRPTHGSVALFGMSLSEVPVRQRARTLAFVPQETHLIFDFTVEEVVLMGRSPHLGLLGLETERDRAIASTAMERTDVLHLAGRPFRALSGGERQRAVLARALAQEPRVLLLDEPTAHLDLRHQIALYEILARLNSETGLTLVLASHDINLATRYSGRVVLLHEGRVAADGPPESVLDPATLGAVYGVRVDVRRDPSTGRPVVVPLSLA
jgi:iron complex transport system ATP-binding protein